jgi:serine/threonine-protein kinase
MMEAPPRVTGVRGDLSPAIDGVVAKAMSKSRSDRYATCAEMMGAAKEALRGAPGHAVPPPPMPTVTRPDAPPLSPMPQMPVPAQVVTPPPGPVQDEPSSPVPQFPPPQLIPSPPPQPSPSPPPHSLNFPPPQGSPVAPQPSVPGRTTPQPPPLAYPPPGYGEQVPEPVAKRTKTAFTCGVVGVCLGIFFVGLPIAIIAIVQGLKARTELDELRTAPVLRAKAQRAVTLGWIGIGLTVFSVIAQIVQAVK